MCSSDLQNTRQQMSCKHRGQTHSQNRSRSSNIPPLPIKDSHPQRVVEDRVVESVLPLHPKFFRGSTHVRPKTIVPVKLGEWVILPALKMLKRVEVFLPRKDSSMPTMLGNLKNQVRGVINDTMTQIPPSKPKDKDRPGWWQTQWGHKC